MSCARATRGRFEIGIGLLLGFLFSCGEQSDRTTVTVSNVDCPAEMIAPDASSDAAGDASAGDNVSVDGTTEDAAPGDGAGANAAADAAAPFDAAAEVAPTCSTCAVELATPANEGAGHVPDCSAVSYASKPPASGNHYGTWPVFRVYGNPVPWGFLMHGLEHGAVVIVYNCPDGCPNDVAGMRALWGATTSKPGCGRPPVIVAPDPTLDVRFAATAWGHTLRAPCFDRAAFARFIVEHADQGPESFPTDCGVLDREATGWCL